MQKITPFLWFNNNAEEAMKFYTSVFDNSKIGKVTYYPEGTPGPFRQHDDGHNATCGAGVHRAERRSTIQIY
jgi:predicted 3-demethylubiquinone-9 3-methyltransferase (glyoxalase superfamily)